MIKVTGDDISRADFDLLNDCAKCKILEDYGFFNENFIDEVRVTKCLAYNNYDLEYIFKAASMFDRIRVHEEMLVPNNSCNVDIISVDYRYDNEDDIVNSPKHYTSKSMECIDWIEADLSRKEFVGYCKGNVLKYIFRYDEKGGIEDLKKAIWYLNRTIETLQKEDYYD